MNKTDNVSEKEKQAECRGITFIEGAKEISFGVFSTADVKDMPQIFPDAETNKTLAPENSAEAKILAKMAKELEKQGHKVTTKEVAETRIARGRSVTKQKLEDKAKEAKEDDSSR